MTRWLAFRCSAFGHSRAFIPKEHGRDRRIIKISVRQLCYPWGLRFFFFVAFVPHPFYSTVFITNACPLFQPLCRTMGRDRWRRPVLHPSPSDPVGWGGWIFINLDVLWMCFTSAGIEFEWGRIFPPSEGDLRCFNWQAIKHYMERGRFCMTNSTILGYEIYFKVLYLYF